MKANKTIKNKSTEMSGGQITKLHQEEVIKQRRKEENEAMEKAKYMLAINRSLFEPSPDWYESAIEFIDADNLYRQELTKYYYAILNGEMRAL